MRQTSFRVRNKKTSFCKKQKKNFLYDEKASARTNEKESNEIGESQKIARNALVLNYGKMNNKFTLCTIHKRYLGYKATTKNCICV